MTELILINSILIATIVFVFKIALDKVKARLYELEQINKIFNASLDDINGDINSLIKRTNGTHQ